MAEAEKTRYSAAVLFLRAVKSKVGNHAFCHKLLLYDFYLANYPYVPHKKQAMYHLWLLIMREYDNCSHYHPQQ